MSICVLCYNGLHNVIFLFPDNCKEIMKAAFFDRDGTLIKDVHYLSSLDQIQLIERVVAFAATCQKKGYTLFVVTNQSGIARGYFSAQFVEQTHNALYHQLQQRGVMIKKFYYCPHHPTHAVIPELLIDCYCRKPWPGMLLKAAQEHGINLQDSLMFGDKQLDVDAGQAAGCRGFIIDQVLEQSPAWWDEKIFAIQKIKNDIK